MNADRASTSAAAGHSLLRAIGPGILLAGVAVGASHLVQSTRAGAEYGTGLVFVVLLAMAAKYPAYRFAPRYTAATGASMIEGFSRQGSWALWVFIISTFGTVFVGGAAITMVAAGILKATFSMAAAPSSIAIGLLAVTAAILIIGHYHWLDLLMKPLMIGLSIATLIAAVLVIPRIDWSLSGRLLPTEFDVRTLLFMVAFFGWMPAPLEAAVIHTLWSQAKARDIGYRPSTRESTIDFHIGYVGILFLAICFVLLGAGLMHGSGLSFQDSAGGFAAQVIDLYAQTLGGWTGPFIGIMAFSVMYSTVIAHLDGFSRIIDGIIWHFQSGGDPRAEWATATRHKIYAGSLVFLCSGVTIVILFFMTSFKTLIDISASIAFLSTPIFAILIHRAMTSHDVPQELKPGKSMLRYSILCNVFLITFALGYIVMLFTIY